MSLYRLWFGRKYGLIPKSIRPSRRRPRAVRPRLGLTTLESRIVPGLHLAGEILDLDGLIGGYNFQAAWSTGWLAGEQAASSR